LQLQLLEADIHEKPLREKPKRACHNSPTARVACGPAPNVGNAVRRVSPNDAARAKHVAVAGHRRRRTVFPGHPLAARARSEVLASVVLRVRLREPKRVDKVGVAVAKPD
jgi:hypothetical protein